MVGSLPPECNSDQSIEAIQELCKIATSMISNGQHSDGSSARQSSTRLNPKSIQPVMEFLKETIKVYGSSVDEGGEVSQCIESLIVKVMDGNGKVKHGMGKRTESGQLAFESKKLSAIEKRETDAIAEEYQAELDVALSTFLPLLKIHSPNFYLRVVPITLQSS